MKIVPIESDPVKIVDLINKMHIVYYFDTESEYINRVTGEYVGDLINFCDNLDYVFFYLESEDLYD